MRFPEPHSSIAPVTFIPRQETSVTGKVHPAERIMSILDEPIPKFRISLIPRGHIEWSTLTISWISNLTPVIEDSWVEVPDETPLEQTMAMMLAEGKVSEDFIVDLFKQQAFYEEYEKDLQRKFAGKEIVICGGKVFAADNFEVAAADARREFPERPYYSVSFAESPTTF